MNWIGEEICPNCAAIREVVCVWVAQEFTVLGKRISLLMERDRCTVCGEIIFDDEKDQILMEKLYATLYN